MAEHNLTTPDEIWKDIPDHPGYQVSGHGRVRSFLKRVGGDGRGCFFVLAATPQKILKSIIKKHGYIHVNLRGRWFMVHRLVLWAFVGPCPPGFEACHGDGRPANNFLENLRWDTPKSNGRDMVKHGTAGRCKGEKHGLAKLTSDEVKHIRAMHSAGGWTQREIGKLYGVGQITIWKHVNP